MIKSVDFQKNLDEELNYENKQFYFDKELMCEKANETTVNRDTKLVSSEEEKGKLEVEPLNCESFIEAPLSFRQVDVVGELA